MKYDLSKPLDKNKALTYFSKLLDSDKKIEIKEIRQTRSLSQNAYLHVCINLYAINFGWTAAEAKTHLKRSCGFMYYQKNGEKFLKSTVTDSKELSEFIDWIRNHAAQEGCYIPTADEYIENKITIDKEIESHKTYL